MPICTGCRSVNGPYSNTVGVQVPTSTGTIVAYSDELSVGVRDRTLSVIFDLQLALILISHAAEPVDIAYVDVCRDWS